MSYPPRNIAAAREHIERSDKPMGPAIVISLVGQTSLRFPHVFVDPGRSYDFSDLALAQCVIATKPGVDSGRTIAEVFEAAERGFFCSGFPLVADVEERAVAHVWSIRPLQFRAHKPDSRTWAACFG